jgi:hypothetical protein
MVAASDASRVVRNMAQEQTRPMDKSFLIEVAELIEQQEKVIACLEEKLSYY